MSQRTAERPACFSHPFYEVSHSLLWRAWVTMNSWNHCGNKCYIMYLSIKHVWMYFVKTNCNDMKGGRLLVYIDFFCSSIKAEEWSRKVIKNEIILHASICICFSKAASHCLHLEEICIAQKIGVMGKLVLLPRLCSQSSVSGTPWFHLQCKWSLDEYHVDNEHITSPAGADFPLKKKEKKNPQKSQTHSEMKGWKIIKLLF